MIATASRRPRTAARANRPPVAYVAWRIAAGAATFALAVMIGPPALAVVGLAVAFGAGWAWTWRLELVTAAGLLIVGRAGIPLVVLAAVPLAAIALERGARDGRPAGARRPFGLDPRRWPRRTRDAVGAGLEALGAILGRKGVSPRWLTVLANGGRLVAAPYRAASWRRWWHRSTRNAGLPATRVRRVSETPTGWRLEISTTPGTPVHVLGAHAEHLATTLAARAVRVTRNPANAGRATVYVVLRDPFASSTGIPWPNRDAATLSIWRPVPVGVDENGRAVTLELPGRNLFLSGEPGAGKTTAQQILVAACALDPTVSLTILDGKQVDLVDWEPRCSRFAGADVKEANAALEAAAEWMTASYDRLRAAGRKKVGPGDPVHVVIVDELAFYLGTRDRASKAFAATLRDLVARGRAAGVVVIAATQRPGSDLIPTSLRDLFAYRLALRCTTPQASDMALGQGWAANGYDATSIPSSQRGVGLLLAEGDVPIRFRGYHLADAEVASIAARAADLGPAPSPHKAIIDTSGAVEPGAVAVTASRGGNTGERGDVPGPPPTGAPVAPRLPASARVNVRPACGAPGAGVARATRSDKQLAVEAELLRAPGDSDRAIGRRVGVDHKTVGAARRRLAVTHG